MQIVFDDAAGRHELDLRVNNPAATIADLATALQPHHDGRPLLVGDRPTDPDLELREAGLYEGVVVRFAPDPYDTPQLVPTSAPVGWGAVETADPYGPPAVHATPPGPPGHGAPPAYGAPSTPTPGAQPGAPSGYGAPSGHGAPPGHRPNRSAFTRELELVVVNGLDAGRRFPLAPGTVVIGRGQGCDVVVHHGTVSKRHAALSLTPEGDVTIVDLGSHNGTWLDGEPVYPAPSEPVDVPEDRPLQLGALELQVRQVRQHDKPLGLDPLRDTNAAGTIPFNRPPRTAPPPPLAEITLPQAPRTGGGKGSFSIISIIAPLIFAGGMFMIMKSPQFLMFGLLSPVMAIGNAIDSKRKGRKSDRSEKERFRKDLAQLRDDLSRRGNEERERRHASHPDPPEVLRRVTLPSMALWERRPGHPDFLQLRAGVGDVPWDPPVPPPSSPPPEQVVEALDEASTLAHATVPIDLASGGVLGIVGDRQAALALARSLVCQAAVLHGPADVPVMVLAGQPAGRDWDWAKWLPHTRGPSGGDRILSHDRDLSTRMVEARLDAARASRDDRRGRPPPGARQGSPVGPTLLVVVDDESLISGRRAPTRNLLRGDAGLVAGIVIASTPDRLPALCTAVVEMDGLDGQARLLLPQRGQRVEGFLACGFGDDLARECARTLACYEDPELDLVGAGLPASIRLLPLLELEECTPEAIRSRWKRSAHTPSRVATPVGVAESGVFPVDIVADGPHGLVGGTTGAGKSELLRTIVAGLAATLDPDHLTFVLIDFKGGSAFDECSKLPHTVGMVTDLDEHLAERALICLEAELKHRERVLRQAGATDLPDYLRSSQATEPLPRLLVIIDEFATLKAELPQFVDALVGVAQRGRSLGVHLLLATQRPQGAISENIKANTNLRIALRVQGAPDSTDIIDVPDAAAIPRTSPGRAYVRLGHDEVVPIQTALSTGARSDDALLPVDLAPFVYGPVPRMEAQAQAPTQASAPTDGPDDGAEETDLSLLVGAIHDAFAATGRPRPRRPWPDPLPTEVDLDTLIDEALEPVAGDAGRLDHVPVALADDPGGQRQHPTGWRPADGNLLIYGVVGSGTTTLLTSLALSLARLHPPDELHLYAMDFGAGELAPLADLPHCGGVVLATERERQQRLIRMLRQELDRRRQLPKDDRADQPTIVTLVDGWAAFMADYNDYTSNQFVDSLVRVCADGPDVGMYVMLTGDRPNAISTQIAATARQRWAFRLATTSDFAVVGVMSRAVPSMVPGHALVSESKQLVHVARPRDGVTAAVERITGQHREAQVPAAAMPAPVLPLATTVHLRELDAEAHLGTRPWVVPIGLGEADLTPTSLVAYEGEHVQVLGPARSGRSTLLLTVAAAVHRAQPDARIGVVASPRSPLAHDPRVTDLVDPTDLDKLPPIIQSEAPVVLILIDDAEGIDDARLATLVTSRRPNLLAVVAGRADVLRTDYNHWSRGIRRSKLGVLLQPNLDWGDMVGAQLPRRVVVPMVTGRGFVAVNGDAALSQMALPD